MKKFILALVLTAFSVTSFAQHGHGHRHHNHRDRDVLPAIILGTAVGIAIANQNRPPPQPVYVPPQPVYIPPQVNRVYPHYAPRVMTSHEPCYYSGQMVMIFDQWGHSMGFDACR